MLVTHAPFQFIVAGANEEVTACVNEAVRRIGAANNVPVVEFGNYVCPAATFASCPADSSRERFDHLHWSGPEAVSHATWIVQQAIALTS